MKKTEQIVTEAIIKGAVHATVVPMLVAVFVNTVFTGNWGFVVALGYIMFASVIYYFSKDKDISKMVFVGIIKFYALIILGYLGMFIIAAS